MKPPREQLKEHMLRGRSPRAWQACFTHGLGRGSQSQGPWAPCTQFQMLPDSLSPPNVTENDGGRNWGRDSVGKVPVVQA